MSYLITGVASQRIIEQRRPDKMAELKTIWNDLPHVGYGAVFDEGSACLSQVRYWPSGGLLTGQLEPVVSQMWWGYSLQYTGTSNFPYRIRGTVLDSGGSFVGNARVMLFRTSDNVFIRESVSVSTDGTYDLGTEDNTTDYFVVVYRSAPPIMGTTENNLKGSA